MESENLEIKVCPWLGDKQWTYSITFDEALSELHCYTIPILEEFGVPGHLEVVVGQMGQVRRLLQSTYNGLHHMGPDELKEMLRRGWGVGSHSWSHTYINLANEDRELGEGKRVLEEAIGAPVTVYCSPGGNFNMADEILEMARSYGFLGAMSLYEALNRPQADDLLWLNRTFLHDNGPDTFDAEFDPFRKIMHAQRARGWVIDYLHCPMEQALHPRKDCSAGQLRERMEVVTENRGEVWLAKVEDPMDYRYTHHHLKVEKPAEDVFHLWTEGLPEGVQSRVLTFKVPALTRGVEIDGHPAELYQPRNKRLVDVDLSSKRTLKVYTA